MSVLFLIDLFGSLFKISLRIKGSLYICHLRTWLVISSYDSLDQEPGTKILHYPQIIFVSIAWYFRVLILPTLLLVSLVSSSLSQAGKKDEIQGTSLKLSNKKDIWGRIRISYSRSVDIAAFVVSRSSIIYEIFGISFRVPDSATLVAPSFSLFVLSESSMIFLPFSPGKLKE